MTASSELRVVSGSPWTIDGRWVVIGPMYERTMIVYDPDNKDPWADIQDCLKFIKDKTSVSP